MANDHNEIATEVYKIRLLVFVKTNQSKLLQLFSRIREKAYKF